MRDGVNSVLKLFTISIYTDFRHISQINKERRKNKKNKKRCPRCPEVLKVLATRKKNLHKGIQKMCTGGPCVYWSFARPDFTDRQVSLCQCRRSLLNELITVCIKKKNYCYF